MHQLFYATAETARAPVSVEKRPEKPSRQAQPVAFDPAQARSKIWGPGPPWRAHKPPESPTDSEWEGLGGGFGFGEVRDPVEYAREKRGTVLSWRAVAGDKGDQVVVVVGEKSAGSSTEESLVVFKRDRGAWAVTDRLLLSECQWTNLRPVKLGKRKVGFEHKCIVNAGSGICVGGDNDIALFAVVGDRLKPIDRRITFDGKCDENREVTFEVDDSKGLDIYDVVVLEKRTKVKCTEPSSPDPEAPTADSRPECADYESTTSRTRWRYKGPSIGYVRVILRSVDTPP